MAEAIFWWFFTLACIFGFFFSYGMFENLICKWVRDRQTRKQKLTHRTIDRIPNPEGIGHGDHIRH